MDWCWASSINSEAFTTNEVSGKVNVRHVNCSLQMIYNVDIYYCRYFAIEMNW